MYGTLAHQGQTTSELAAGLTDLALETLAGAALPNDSVETELKLWHTLEAELERERRWRRFIPRPGEAPSVGTVLEDVVSRAARRVAGDWGRSSYNQEGYSERTDE
jgi:hypothetical protein